MIKQITANIILGAIVVSALVFYAPNAIPLKLSTISGKLVYRITATNCWGYDDQWDCSTRKRAVPA